MVNHFSHRCGDTDIEQLAYVETRCDCLKKISSPKKLPSGVSVCDKMRFCKGDGPAIELECGQQRGGHFYCSGCGVRADRVYELDHVARCKVVTFPERQQSVLRGPIGRRLSMALHPKPFAKMSRRDLEEEVRGRGLTANSDLKPDLQQALTEDLKGKTRVPALLFQKPDASLQSLNLHEYEVLPCEPMHDLAGHIGNVLQELPEHLNQEVAALVRESVKLTMEDKEKKRAFDQRCSIIVASSQLRQRAPLKVQQLLNTLVEMQEILYAGESKRSPQLILRYHNLSFTHAMLCNEILGHQPCTMTCRKLYGKHFHDLISHAPLQLRIMSGKAMSAEDEERAFNSIKGITKSTSSNHPGHVIGNILIRLQAEEALRNFNKGGRCCEQQSKITRLSHGLTEFPDTLIPAYILQKYAKEWQAHLEKISDFLIPGAGVWWEFDGENVIFHDSKSHPPTRPEGPDLHHFRSSTLKKEEAYLEESWSQCLQSGIRLPAHFLYLPDKSGNPDRVHKVPTGFLEETPDQEDPGCDDDDNIPLAQHQDIHSYDLEESVCGNKDLEEVPTGLSKETPDQEDLEEHIIAVTVSDPLLNDLEVENDVGSALVCEHSPTFRDIENATSEQSACSPDLYHTRLGKALAEVLGPTTQVKELDQLKAKVKSAPQDKYAFECYMNSLALVQTKVLQQKSIFENELKEWEKQYFINNDFKSPTLADMLADKVAKLVIKRIKCAKALLKAWKINME